MPATSVGTCERFLSDWQADCRNAEDKADILDELEKGVGFDKCNALVVGLLREALVAQGRAALGRLPAAERRGSVLLISMGQLLQNMGKLEEARPLYEERLQGQRETLGDRDEETLGSIFVLADLLERQGKHVEATPLYTEALEGHVLVFGMEDARDTAKRLVSNLREVGQREEAEALADKHGLVELERLASIFNMAYQLEGQGKLGEAIPLYTEELEGRMLLDGMEHSTTRFVAKRLVSTLRKAGQQEEAEALADKHGLADN
eukprot:scaffold31023_cov65-Phaeocystis_antarctica.AAC.2